VVKSDLVGTKKGKLCGIHVGSQFDVSSRTRPELLREQNTLLLELLLDHADTVVDKEVAIAGELQAKCVRI
jgi:hypothetical protein